jgi:transposase
VARRRKNEKKSTVTTLPVMRSNAGGIDIGAREIFVAVPPDRALQNVRSFQTFTQDLYELAAWLKECSVDTVAMESTGVYWIPLYQTLEDAGIEVFLVNARHAKSVPGRKTDVQDCQWLQFLHSVGLLNASFRPTAEVCAIRAIQRHRSRLVQMAATHIQHIQKALSQMNLQIHHVLADIMGRSGLAIIDAVLAGERNPYRLFKLCNQRVKASEEVIVKSLVGDYRAEHIFTLRQSLATYRAYEKLVDECDSEIKRLLSEFNGPSDPDEPLPKKPRKKRNRSNAESLLAAELKRAFGVDLTEIPSIDIGTAQILFGEIGPDFTKFRSASAFASWLRVCPQNDISGGKVLSSRTKHSKSRSASSLRMAAQTLSHDKSALGDFYRRMRAKFGAPKAITAAAHKLARIIYHLVTTGQSFDDSLFAADQLRYIERQKAKLHAKARVLGFQLVPIQPTSSVS